MSAQKGLQMAVITARERAVYASDPAASRGRRYEEPPSPTRNAFRRDCDRIIHATAFRRLKHKTQVFIFHEGDHYRTRLTHTLEVAQIARSLARALGVDEDLAECLALSHDIGHPPFGHAGERALHECLKSHGGFDHNAQALRIVVELEKRYPQFDGLNLAWETLEGLVKHNGPLTDRGGNPGERYRESGVPQAILDYNHVTDLQLWSFASLEAQIAAVSDDIAYDAHDIDDGLRAGLFSLDDLRAVPFLSALIVEIESQHPRLDPARRVHELVRRVITRLIEDVIAETERRIGEYRPQSADNIRKAGMPLCGFSTVMLDADTAIKGFLYPRMYRHPRVMRIMGEAEGVVRDLFVHYSKFPVTMPDEWAALPSGERERARHIADFIAGMTDRYALTEHERYFDSTPDLR
jgi:dGTPase